MSTLVAMADESAVDAIRVVTLKPEQHVCYANRRSWWITVWRLAGLLDDNGQEVRSWFSSPEEARIYCKTEHINLTEAEETTC